MNQKIAPKELWYGSCSYWTDDWDKLKTTPQGIPVCPHCGAPGFITPEADWLKGAQRFEDEGHPRYVEFLNANKEQCLPRGFLTTYKMWITSQPVTTSD